MTVEFGAGAVAALTPLPQRKRRRINRRVIPYLLVGPLLMLIVVFTVLPSVLTVVLAFFDVSILAGTYKFVGWKNFTDAMARGDIANSIGVTVRYALLTVPPSLLLGLCVALLINGLSGGSNFWRAVYFLPVAATLVAMSLVWRWMFLPRKGIVDTTLGGWLGMTDWLNTPALALPAVAIVGNWQHIGFVAIIYLASLASVPKHLLEAARVDGAGAWSRFWHVTWPALGPTTIFVTVIGSIDALRAFDTIATMTAGGPSKRTETLAYLMWQRGIYFFDIGGGAVVTMVLLAFALIATAIQRRSSSELEAAGTR